jgi:hypothetical protein
MSSLGYALYNENDESSLDAKRHARNKTVKKKFPSDNEQQVKRVLDTIKGGDKEERATLEDGADFNFDEGGDVIDGMADFNPMSNPVLTTVKGESGGGGGVGVGFQTRQGFPRFQRTRLVGYHFNLLNRCDTLPARSRQFLVLRVRGNPLQPHGRERVNDRVGEAKVRDPGAPCGDLRARKVHAHKLGVRILRG